MKGWKALESELTSGRKRRRTRKRPAAAVSGPNAGDAGHAVDDPEANAIEQEALEDFFGNMF